MDQANNESVHLRFHLGCHFGSRSLFIFIAGLGWFHGYVIDVPRRRFRGDPKYRDEYDLKFSDAGMEFKTPHVSASLQWSLYTRVIENDRFYIMVYGRDIHSLSIIPKRAFREAAASES